MNGPKTISELQIWANEQFGKAGTSVPRHEVNLLLMAATGMDKAALISAANAIASPQDVVTFTTYIERRAGREPVHRILGRREFHSLDFQLSEATLEPRDDTECLVELALNQVSDPHEELAILDLGTGTGAVALALLQDLPNAHATAVDVEPKALEMASINARHNGLADRFTALESSWFDQVTGQFDLIVSNPPYIASAELLSLEPEVVRFDPVLALDGGADGLDAYRAIIASARNHLKTGGFVVLEIGHDQRVSVSKIAAATGWKVTQTATDLAGRDRAICLQ
jgi:release factor glutamine methyltransferase